MSEDKDAIRELLHLYCFCMDEGRFVDLVGYSFRISCGALHTATGPEAITAWLTQSVPATPRRMHYVMNSIIGGLLMTLGGVPTAAACWAQAALPSAAVPRVPAVMRNNARRDGAFRSSVIIVIPPGYKGRHYFQLLIQNRGSSSVYGLKLNCRDMP